MIKKTASIILAFILLVSTSHLSFATHFCGGHAAKHGLLVDINDFGCGMEDEITPHETDGCNIENNCCRNESLNLTINDDFQNIALKDFSNPHFILANFASILFTVSTPTKSIDSYKNYKPPLPDKDIPVLIQSFRI
jgi:hypothetical protein